MKTDIDTPEDLELSLQNGKKTFGLHVVRMIFQAYQQQKWTADGLKYIYHWNLRCKYCGSPYYLSSGFHLGEIFGYCSNQNCNWAHFAELLSIKGRLIEHDKLEKQLGIKHEYNP